MPKTFATRWRSAVIAMFLFSCGAVSAQALPAALNAGQELLRQQERDNQLRRQQEPRPNINLQPPAPRVSDVYLVRDEAPCFVIHRLVLTGELSEKFQWLISAAERTASGKEDSPFNLCLGTAALNQLMQRMQSALIAQGYVTSRVLAPQQDLSTGVVELKFFPGRIRNIRFDAETSTRATQWNAVPAQSGDVLNLRDIEQALENFKRVPTAVADIQITPTEETETRIGESDIVIRWRQAQPFRVSMGVDNSGSKSTGRYLGSATLSYDHWWTLNDLFYISLNHDLGGGHLGARGSRGQVVHYSLPMGYWLMGLTTSSNRYYQQVAGVNGLVRYSGDANNHEIRLSRIAYRDAVRKTTASFALWMRESSNQLFQNAIENQQRRMAGWDVGIEHRENIDDAVLELAANFRRGTGFWGALHAPEEITGTGTSRPQIARFSAKLNLPFTLGKQSLRYAFAFSAQRSFTNLVPQDRFAIGSRYTVRGFDEQNFLSSEHGLTLHNDISLPLNQSAHQLYLGIDHGQLSGRSTQELVGTHLTGAAIGLRGAVRPLSYDVFVATPLSKPQGFTSDSFNLGFALNLVF